MITEDVLKNYPPLIRQYIEIQMKYPDAIILTEVGTFYEIWQLDELNIGHAIKASQIMNITLTRRDKSDPTSPRMAGVPNYTVDNYIKKIVEAGETAIVVSQSKNGKKGDKNKDISREIERIVTPATYIDKIEQSNPKYFASCFFEGDIIGVSLIDVSTGEVRLSEIPKNEILNYFHKNEPSEILICNAQDSNDLIFNSKIKIHSLSKKIISRPDLAGTVFAQVYEITNPSSNNEVILSKLGLEFWTLASLSLANLLNYLVDYNPILLKKIGRPQPDHPKESMFLPKNAFMSLDILDNPTDKDSNQHLLGILNQSKTAMGKRLLRHWIASPLVDLSKILDRQNKVKSFIETKNFLDELKKVYDLSRLQRRISVQSLAPHEIVFFKNSLETSNKIVKNKKINGLIKFLEENFNLSKLENTGGTDWIFFEGSLFKRIEDSLKMWKKSQEQLDNETQKLQKIFGSDKLKLKETREYILLSGPKSLAKACKENKIEVKVKSSEIEILDENWIKLAQTVFANKYAYIAKAEQLWEDCQNELSQSYASEVLVFSDEVAEIDVLSSLAQISYERKYTCPKFIETDDGSSVLKMKNVRHPVVETIKTLSETYTPNSVSLSKESNTIVIYGANSSGKSTLLKSLALNIIMAQIGCFVACEVAELTVFQNIMTRMTTYDQLSEGLSTFTMEMVELQSALKKMNENALFLFDEIGRGTSVEDGEAIAFATLEYLRKESSNSLTLFATHYHTLYDNIKEFLNIQVKHLHCEINEKEEVIFHRQLMNGPGSGSYGIVVAKSCGLPEEMIRLAKNYSKDNKKMVISRYNSSITGSICPICNENQVHETHHLIDQKQGKVEEVIIDGVKKDVNDKANLLLICSQCHTKITLNKIQIEKKKSTKVGGYTIIVKTLSQNEKN
jgi:DNA mismatch repair protein MutS